MNRVLTAFLAYLFSLMVLPGVVTAQAGRPTPGREPSPAEVQAWNRVNMEFDLKRKGRLAEDYLKQHPEGAFVPYAHEVIAVNALQSSKMDAFFEHAELAVAGLPNEVSLMSALSAAYAEKQEPGPALRHGEAALAILPTMERPAEYSEESWPQRRARFLGDSHYGVGTAYLFNAYQQGSGSPLMAKAMDHLRKAAELVPQDDRVRFRLGFGYQLNGDWENAALEYARVIALGGVNSLAARQYLEQSYQKVHGNTRGLDKFISEQKEYLRGLAAGGK